MKNILIFILILIIGIQNIDYIKSSFERATHQNYCYDVYRGRDYLFNKCMNEPLKK